MKTSLRLPDAHVSLAKNDSFETQAGTHVLNNVRMIPGQEKELVVLSDPRAYRSMSRASLLVSAVSLDLADVIKPLIDADPFSVGIYCAINNGPEDYTSASELRNGNPDEFAIQYKRLRNPKHYLKQLPNLAPAQLGIFLGAFGPTNTYSHSRFGVRHALKHAMQDLRSGKVKGALVCSAFAHEDILLSFRSRMGLDSSRVLSEGAAALFMETTDLDREFNVIPKEDQTSFTSDFFGIADDLIKLIQQGEFK